MQQFCTSLGYIVHLFGGHTAQTKMYNNGTDNVALIENKLILFHCKFDHTNFLIEVHCKFDHKNCPIEVDNVNCKEPTLLSTLLSGLIQNFILGNCIF